jgi:NAD(P) transhydrogenase subunit alpha
MATIAVLRETAQGERRVAMVPESVSRLIRGGAEVRVEPGAGAGAVIPDSAFEQVGARLVEGDALLAGANAVVCVRRPSTELITRLEQGTVLIGLLQPGADEAFEEEARTAGVVALALERVPRITRAQTMDVLSSQSTVAGYMAVLFGATRMTRFLPMLTTAAGAIPPGRAFVIGAGVAGLQAIATARRLGAIVSAFDIRPAAAEQVKSLGASFVASEALAAEAETAGGYARAQSEAEHERTLRAIGGHISDMDLVVTTAQIPGRPAPKLITESMVQSMRPGSVIVDVAAETGGNCSLSVPGETISVQGVTIMAPLNLPSSLPLHASQMFSRNVLALLQHLIRDGEVRIEAGDEIIGPMLADRAVGAAS